MNSNLKARVNGFLESWKKRITFERITFRNRWSIEIFLELSDEQQTDNEWFDQINFTIVQAEQNIYHGEINLPNVVESIFLAFSFFICFNFFPIK